MSESTINLSNESPDADSSILTVAEWRAAVRDAQAEIARLKEDHDAQQQLRFAAQDEAKKANTRLYEEQIALRRYKVQVRDAIVEFKNEHDLDRSDVNELLSTLGLDLLKRKIKGRVRLTYTVDVDIEDIEIEDGDDEDDAVAEAANEYDSSDVDTYDLELQDTEVLEWEEQEEE